MTIAPVRAARTLRQNWKVTIIAVASLGVAMALAVASLSISNTFLFLPLPGAEPGNLVTIAERAPGSTDLKEISYPDYQYFRQNNHSFVDLGAAPNSISVNIDADDNGHEQIRVISRPVSDNYFSVLGLRPYLGRLFVDGDDRANPPVAVMTYQAWKRLGLKADIVGRNISGHLIVGVAPPEFTGSLYGINGDLVLSLDEGQRSPKRDNRTLILFGRLKPGVTRGQAQTEMRGLAAQLAAAYPKEDKDRVPQLNRATLLPPDAVPTAELAAAILGGLVLLVLLIACANVANLLLAVAVGRRREAAIKMALGAQRGRLIREFLWEGAILCAAAAVLGYAIAAVAVARFSDISMRFPLYGAYHFGLNLHLDATVALGTAGIVLIAILATGLVPALYASSPHLAQMIAAEVVVGGTHKNARRNALVIVQIGVCTLVLVGAGLCARTIYNLHHVDVGFTERNLIADPLYLKNQGFDQARGKQLYEQVRRAAAALPGVEAVTLASDLPLFGATPAAVQPPGGGPKLQVSNAVVDADYFSTLGFRRLGGRVFDSRDQEKSPLVIVINQKMAEMFWPNQNPIGLTIQVDEPARTATVVGVVGDAKYDGLDDDPKPFFYSPLAQTYQEVLQVILRTRGDPALLQVPLAQAMRNLGFTAPIQPATYDAWMNVTILGERIAAIVVTVLSGLGLALAIVGLAAAISYSVSERRRELGIRIALGAGSWQLLQMILRQTGRIAGIGIAAGLLLGVGGTVLVKSQLYGIGSVEFTVLIPVALGVMAVALLVAYLSALPWIRIDPMEAVRHT